MKEQAIVPELRFSEFENKLFLQKFEDVLDSNIYGPRFNANDYDLNGNVKTIRGTDVSLDGEIKYEQIPIAAIEDSTVEHHKLLDGDLIIITTADCGKVGVFREQSMPYISSAYGVRLRLNENGFPYYFKYYFQTGFSKNEVNKYIRKATVSNLPSSDILRFKTLIPSLEEQQKIAGFLSAVDKKISLLKDKHRLLVQYKKGVMQQIFSQQIRFKDDNGQDFPDWEKVKLSELLYEHKIRNESLDYNRNDVLSVSGDLGVVNQIEHLGRSYAGESVHNYHVVHRGDIVYTKSPLKANPYGIIKANKGPVGIVSTLYAVYTPNERAYADYLDYYFWLDDNVNRYLRPLVHKGAKNDMKINNQRVLIDPIACPCLDEQKKISRFLDKIDQKIKLINQQVNQAQKYKNGLLQKMFV